MGRSRVVREEGKRCRQMCSGSSIFHSLQASSPGECPFPRAERPELVREQGLHHWPHTNEGSLNIGYPATRYGAISANTARVLQYAPRAFG